MELCRLCLKSNTKLFNIFVCNGDHWSNISDYILHFFSIEIKQSDKTSTKICKECLEFIILCCKKRLKYRENDKLFNTFSNHMNETKTPLKIHSSVLKIITEYSNINIIPQTFWNSNFDPKVLLIKIDEKCLRTSKPVTRNIPRKGNKRSRSLSETPQKTAKSFTEVCQPEYIHSKEFTGTSSETNIKENTMEFQKRSLSSYRFSKKPKLYGDPVFYEEIDVNPMNLFLEKSIEGTNKKQNRNGPVFRRSRSRRRSISSGSPLTDRSYMSKYETKKCSVEGTPYNSVFCSEDVWNSFVESNYTNEKCNVKTDKEHLLKSDVELPVYICQICNEVCDNNHALQRHIDYYHSIKKILHNKFSKKSLL